jgi:hypothetical protein
MLRTLMEIRAPDPDRFHALEDPRVRQVCKRWSDRLPITDKTTSHGETLFPLCV